VQELDRLMLHLNSCGLQFAVPCPLSSRAGPDCIQLTRSELCEGNSEEPINNAHSSQFTDSKVDQFPVRVLTYIRGETFDSVEKKFLTPEMLRQVGEMLGYISKELKVNM